MFLATLHGKLVYRKSSFSSAFLLFWISGILMKFSKHMKFNVKGNCICNHMFKNSQKPHELDQTLLA